MIKAYAIAGAIGISLLYTLGVYTIGVSSGKEQIREQMTKQTAAANLVAEQYLIENKRIREALAKKNTTKVAKYVKSVPNRECLDAVGVGLFNLAD